MDMEWNQALTFSEMVKDPVFLTGEIIQIGAIKLNQTIEASLYTEYTPAQLQKVETALTLT